MEPQTLIVVLLVAFLILLAGGGWVYSRLRGQPDHRDERVTRFSSNVPERKRI
jgi:hypothetical protein